MYLLPAGMPARSKTKWGGLGILPAMMDRSTIDRYSGGATRLLPYVPPASNMIRYVPPTSTAPRPPIVPVVEKPSPIVAPPVARPPVFPGPPARAPISILPIVRAPIPLPIVPKPPVAVPSPNTGTPVPSGFPTNQFFVASDGSVWEFGNGKWFNTGTPYSAPGASSPATPAPVPSAPAASSGGSSSPSAPVNVSVTSDSGYQTILDWLPQSTLLSFAPNWAVVGGVGLIAWKMFGKGGR